MAQHVTLGVIVGSLRRDSVNRKAARALAALAPSHVDFAVIEIGDLPFYNEDLEGSDAPAPWLRLRKQILAADAILFVTPEYNRSVPAALKNAIDVGSRPFGESVWAGKPAAIMSLSPGALGGFGSNQHVRQALVPLDMPLLPAPEAYVGHAFSLFDKDGQLSNEKTRDLFERFMKAFADWIVRTSRQMTEHAASPRGIYR